MVFRKKFSFKKAVSRVVVYATAMGVYRLDVNGIKAGDRYFAPGFTSYKHTLQYQTYDVAALAEENTEFVFAVAGGWAVGSFVFTRANRISADRQALLAEIRVKYADGTEEVFGTGTDWQVSEGGSWLEADLYDGEVYDASADINNNVWCSATIERLKINPEIIAETGSPVRAHEVFTPISCTKRADGELIYDFGQNFAGVIRAEIDGKAGQKILFRHAEVLNADGSLATGLLRSAKARAEYICKDGKQSYSPEFTYISFRYVGVKGADEENLKLSAVALYSDVESCGSFSCSDERINKLQSNIVWGAKSNFVEIPTDCPQRDERMGDFWGDACAMVPWAEYMARGDKRLPEKMYPVMKKYVKACKFRAGFGFGKHRYIWHTPHLLHFGDWVAPDVNKMSEWQKRSRWTATASLCHTSQLTARVAEILGRADEAKYYNNLAAKVADAYVSVFSDGNGTGGMISFNHYASGAVGDFLYKRVAGIIPEEGGYKKFTVKPLVGGGLTHARGETICPYGKLVSEWRVENGVFTLSVTVPVSAECTVVLPDGKTFATASGGYTYSCRL